MKDAIVDTNVLLVANGRHEDVSVECVAACASRLQDLTKNGRLVIDDEFRILTEYQNKTQPRSGKGVGDAFLKWALRNWTNPNHCMRAPITEHPQRGFANFPDDPRLSDFDRSDRKFVAVAVAHGGPVPILQATDSKWLKWREALKDHGMEVQFLCPETIQRFAKQKAKKSPSKDG